MRRIYVVTQDEPRLYLSRTSIAAPYTLTDNQQLGCIFDTMQEAEELAAIMATYIHPPLVVMKLNDANTITWNEFEKIYKPLKNPLNNDAPYDGCMIETFGNELTLIQQPSATGRTWTIFDNGRMTNGVFVANRFTPAGSLKQIRISENKEMIRITNF